MLLKIPQGQVSVDAKRGQIFLISGTQAVDLSGFGSGVNRFLTDHLAFEILRYFPNVPVDNHFKGLGLHGVYDSKYDRVLITKLDYIPNFNNIIYDEVTEEFYVVKVVNGLTIKTPVNLTDQEYFCNKSWTLSFNFNTKSWISFHSYLPNWYIAENNFFYSGVNGCCEDIEAIVGTIGPIPTTTTTSSSSTTSTSSTTTTTTTLSCGLTGTAIETNPITTTTTTTAAPPCERPADLITEYFFTGYDIIAPPSNVVSTATVEDACSAVQFLNDDISGGVYTNAIPTYIIVQYQGVYVGSQVYLYNNSTDCTIIPNGWYFTGATQAANTVFHVVDGVIVQISICTTTTTSTTTTCLAGTYFLLTFPQLSCLDACLAGLDFGVESTTPVLGLGTFLYEVGSCLSTPVPAGYYGDNISCYEVDVNGEIISMSLCTTTTTTTTLLDCAFIGTAVETAPLP